MNRNYQLDHINRRNAQLAQRRYTEGKNAQIAAINQVGQDWLSHGHKSGRPGSGQWYDQRVASVAHPIGHQMEQAHNDKMAAISNYMANEMAQVQDRMADMGESRIASKNRSDTLAYNLQREKAHLDNQLGQQQNQSLQGLSNSLGNMKFNFDQPEMPDTNLYDNNGEKVGGSQYGGNSLFAKTGIKNSLMRS